MNKKSLFYRVTHLIPVSIYIYSLILFTLFSFVLFKENDLNNEYKKYFKETEVVKTSLFKVVRLIGYDGFIHNFKNYIIRRDDLYKRKAKKNLHQSIDLLKSIKLSVGNSQKDLKNINSILQTLNEYKEKLFLDPSSIQIKNLDEMVKVNDQEAATSLLELYNSFDLKSQVMLKKISQQIQAFRILLIIVFTITLIIFMYSWYIFSRNSKKSQIKSMRTEKKLDFLINSATSGFWEYDIKSSKYKVSTNFWSKLNLATEDHPLVFEKEKLHSLIDKNDLKKILSREYQNSSLTTVNQIRVPQSHNKVIHLSRFTKVLSWDKNQEPAILIGFHIDKSETIRLQKELENRSKFEIDLAMSSTAGNLSTSMAKDLTQHLITLKRNLGQFDFKKHLKLQDNINTIERLNNSLISITDKHKQDQYEQLSLLEVLNESQSIIQPRIDDFNISIQNNIPSDLYILGNRVSLIHVFTILFTNSIESLVILNEKWIDISFSEDEQYYHINFKDSGKRLPRNIERQIFSPSFSTKMKKGAGYGLTIAQSILKSHDGEIIVDEKEFDNMSFKISFPKV